MDLDRQISRSASDISLEIQELVLLDVPAPNRQILQQTVTTELTRLFQIQGVPQSLVQTGDCAVIQSDITINVDARPDNQLGLEIAQAIYRGLGG